MTTTTGSDRTRRQRPNVALRFTNNAMVIYGDGFRLYAPNGSSLKELAAWTEAVASSTRTTLALIAEGFDFSEDAGAYQDSADAML